MTDAYKCENCDEFRSGNGKRLRVGEYLGSSAYGVDQYNFGVCIEVCPSCYEDVIDTAKSVLEDD